MVEKISVQIALEGGAQVEKQLADIGAAGEKSFAQIGAAGDQANEGIAKTGATTEKAAESTSKLTLANVALVAAIAKSTSGVALHGVEIVQAVRHHETLLQSLLKLVSGANTATKALGLIAPELALVGAGALAIAGPIAGAVTAFEVLEKVATKFASSTEKINNTLQTLAATSGESFDKLQVGEAAFKQIGISADTFRGSIAKINETLAGTEVTNLTRGMKDVVELVKQIAAGDKTISFANWVTAEDKIKGVSIAMKQAADAGKNATQVLLEFLRSADLATSIKVGAAFGLSEADVDRVRRLDGSIADLIQRIQGAGPLISPESAAAFDRMRTSIANADSAWARFKQSLDSTVFTTLAANFSATMNDMKAAALNGAAAISEAMGRALSGMGTQAASDVAAIGAALSEVSQQIGATDLFKQMGTDVRNAVSGLNSLVASMAGSIMQAMGASAQSIQAVKNEINGVAPAVNAAGQAVQQASVMWTSYGTVAQQGANTAKAGVAEVTAMWTSYGTVASQSGDKAKASMEAAAGPTKSLSDKVAEFASKLLSITWDAISSVGVAAWNGLTGAIGPSVTAVIDFASKLLGITWDTISSTGVAAWNGLTGAIQGAIDKVLEFIGLKPSGPATGQGAPGKARGGMIGGRGTGTSDSNLAWLSRGEFVVRAAAVRKYGSGLFAALNAQRFAGGGPVGGGGDQLWEFLNTVTDQLDRALGALSHDLINTVLQIAKMVETPMQALLQLMAKIKGKAAGGFIGGRGTGTSDSNLAWLSRGEYVTPARAVAQPGVLAFLEALRRSGGNLRSVLDGMGRFALGGMVPRAMPAFAAGGAVGGMSHVTIAFPGLPPIGGLRASSAVVDELHRAAALAQVRSGGRKPSRYS